MSSDAYRLQCILLRASGHNILPFLPDQVGSIWNREVQIDVAGVNFMEKTLILGECKWDRHPIDVDVLRELVEKTTRALPAEGQWQVYYLGFARSRWSEEAIQYARGIKAANMQGERWQAAGVLLRTLDQLDADLAAWTV